MRIRAVSVFEGVVYHCDVVDRSNPCRPTLELDAIVRAGDADSGPLLVTVADYARMAGADARRCLDELTARGRIVEHLGVQHVLFPTWTVVD
jgi:(2Fe-2S) ferredoxin